MPAPHSSEGGEDLLDEDSPAVPLGWISHQLMWRNYVKGVDPRQARCCRVGQ